MNTQNLTVTRFCASAAAIAIAFSAIAAPVMAGQSKNIVHRPATFCAGMYTKSMSSTCACADMVPQAPQPEACHRAMSISAPVHVGPGLGSDKSAGRVR